MTRATLAMLLLLAQAVAPQPASPSGEDTGQIRGRVTDKETGQPLPNAQVMLTERTLNLNRTATTDDAGVFRFTRLPPGKYDGVVTAGSYRSTHDIQRLPDSRPPAPIELTKGAVREINIALSRTPAIPVRVVDEFGDPLSDVYLRAYRAPAMTHGRVPMNHRTDDRGRMRIAGLGPGRYVVCADTLGTGGTQTVKNPLRERLLRTCYPSAANEADAEPVVVGTGPVERNRNPHAPRTDLHHFGHRAGRVGRACGRRAGRIVRVQPAAAAARRVSRRAGWALSRRQRASRRLRHPGLDRRARPAGGSAPARSRVHPDSRGRQRCRRPRRHVEQRRGRAGPHRARGPDAAAAAVARFRIHGSWHGSPAISCPVLGSGIYAYLRTDRTFTLTGVFGRRTLDFPTSRMAGT